METIDVLHNIHEKRDARMLLFQNGIIHTVDENYPSPEAVLVGSDGRIEAVGSLDELETKIDSDTAIVDLEGRTLIPGFNDAHVHIQWLGFMLTIMVDATITKAPNIPAIIDLYRLKAADVPPNTWITGGGYNENFLPENRHLSRYDLDEASTDHPMILTHTSGHVGVANSKALELAGITKDSPDPQGGHFVRDEKGEPTGVLQETAMDVVYRLIPEATEAQLASAIKTAIKHQLSLGITSATDPMVSPFHIKVYRQLDAKGELNLRVNLMAERKSGEEIFPLPEKYFSDWLRLDCVKFFADGGLTSANAAVSRTFKETGTKGLLIFETEEMAELMWEAHEAGFRIGTHANGDVALEQVIGVYEAIHQRKPVPKLRHRIEHLALPTPGHLERASALGVMVATQTVFLPAMGATYRRYLPDNYISCAYGVRDMLDAGIVTALSTDAPVVPDDNPLIGLKAAVDRLDHERNPIAAEQAITIEEALYAYTMAGAILSGDDDNRGSITPNKWADLVVLSGDLLTTPATDLLDLYVDQTYVGGKLIYQKA
jgi:predicted amidohydrolase YtcJ